MIFHPNNAFYRSAGELKKAQQNEDEHYIISQALQTVKYCELLPQDQEMFKKILDKAFNKCPPDKLPDDVLKNAIEEQCNQNDLEGTKHFLSKVQEVRFFHNFLLKLWFDSKTIKETYLVT